MVDRYVTNGTYRRSAPILTHKRLTSFAGAADRPKTVFGSARATGATWGRGSVEISYRTTERDKAPAREVLTPILMGDPAPGRVVPDTEVAPRRYGNQERYFKDGRRHTESGPVLLTFKEYREYYGESE